MENIETLLHTVIRYPIYYYMVAGIFTFGVHMVTNFLTSLFDIGECEGLSYKYKANTFLYRETKWYLMILFLKSLDFGLLWPLFY